MWITTGSVGQGPNPHVERELAREAIGPKNPYGQAGDRSRTLTQAGKDELALARVGNPHECDPDIQERRATCPCGPAGWTPRGAEGGA